MLFTLIVIEIDLAHTLQPCFLLTSLDHSSSGPIAYMGQLAYCIIYNLRFDSLKAWFIRSSSSYVKGS